MFLLLVFTRLGHECQALLSLCDGMHVCTDQTWEGKGIGRQMALANAVIRKSFGEWSQNPMLTPRGKSLLEVQRRIEPATPHQAGQ